MKNHEVEYRVLSIIERVEKKQPIEDFTVELKAEWPKEINKTARQIAGHANAARGELILCIIGLDQNRGVIGAQYNELSNWFNSVKSEFDGIAPALIDKN